MLFSIQFTHLKESFKYYLYIFISAYLLTSTYQIWAEDSEKLFYQLQHTNGIMFFIIFIACFSLLYGLHEMNDKLIYRHIFYFSSSFYILSYLWKSHNLLMVLGILLIIYIGHFYAYWHKSQASLLYGILGILALIKAYTLSNHPNAHDKFTIDLSDISLHLWLGILLIYIISLLCSQFLLGKISFYLQKIPRTYRRNALKITVITLAGGLLIYICQLLYAKSITQSFSTFDKGLFTQMFENMAQGKGPMTTLERDKWLSHFAVHVSPIFYLMLPFYMIWPSAETLEILQVIVTFSGIIPFYLIIKQLNFSPILRYGLLFIYLFAPALTAGHNYGLHENCFLAPLILWLIYANIKQNRLMIMLFVALTLAVKEDAAIYVVAIGSYFLLQSRFYTGGARKRWVFGVQIVLPIFYFIACLYWLNQHGDGSMTTRFNNFMLEDQTGLTYVVSNIISNPTYTLTSFFTQEKLLYLLTLFSSLAFLPLMQAHWESYLLMIPMIVINLLSDYPYQVNLGFQYHYGSSVLLIFMALLAIDDIRQFHGIHSRWIPTVTIISILVSFTFYQEYLDKASYAHRKFQENPQEYLNRIDTLNSIPSDKNILAFGNFTSHIQGSTALYDIFYHNDRKVDPEIDYLVASQHLLNHENIEKDVIKKYMDAGYQTSDLSSDQIIVLEKPS